MRATIAAFPFVFLTHDLEEALGAERVNELLGRPLAGRLEQLVPGGAPAWLLAASEVSRSEMVIAAGLVFAAGAAVAWPLAARPRRGALTALLVAAASLRLANSLMHGLHAGRARRYVPGLATSLAVGLPYTIVLLRGLRERDLVGGQESLAAGFTGAIMLPPTALAVRLAARRVATLRAPTAPA